MKTFRQELRNWLKSQKEFETNSDKINLLEEIIIKANELEKIEEDTLNRAYHKGHMDAERKKAPAYNYYKNVHKSNSTFRKMLNKNK